MNRIAFIINGNFIYWNSLLLALGALVAICFFLGLYPLRGKQPTAGFIAVAMSTAQVTSAVPLTESEKQQLAEKLSARFGRTVTLECAVDESLLGGMVVRVDGKVLDGSLRGRLHAVKEVMKQ